MLTLAWFTIGQLREEFKGAALEKFDVIVCGSLHLDVVVHAPGLPRIDETMVGRAWKQVCGGKGGNQAVQAARNGAITAMIGRTGEDSFGASLREHLRSSGVDISAVASDPHEASGMSVAIVQDDGEYGAVIVSGANLRIDADAIASQWRGLGGAKVLVLQNEIPHAVNVAAAVAARGQGAIVVLNAAPARPLERDLIDLVDVLIVNRVEAEAICGVPVHDRRSAMAAMSALRAHKNAFVITLGGDGLVARTDDGLVEIEPVPVDVLSTHGAGDCFVGAVAARLAGGASLVEACRDANKVAAAYVSAR
jgi:ribokinase